MKDPKISKGGIVFDDRVHVCYLANLKLRTANRIVMRIATFKATNFRQLQKKLTDLPWELYLHKDATVTFHVSSKKSRLFHSEAISKRCEESLAQRWQRLDGLDETERDLDRCPQQILVRAQNDRFTVSIDSSGDLLHKRGMKIHGGKAPLRETLAAAILSVADYRSYRPLVDPLCGTGTFSLEGAMMANHIPAGWYRDFAFTGWPCFRPSRWKHIRNSAEKEIVHRNQPIIFASDKDPRSCGVLEKTVGDNNLAGTICVFKKNFFDLLPCHIQERTEMSKKGLVVINPPYGRRLETKMDSDKMFVHILKKIKTDFKGWTIALIAPNKKLVKNVPFTVSTYDFFHGGLNLTLLTGKIS
jgi:putative N6-adenine-specific DNA methylase